MKKFGSLIGLTLLLLIILIGCFSFPYLEKRISGSPMLVGSGAFSLSIPVSQENTEMLSLWDDDEGTLYAFLPAHVSLSDVTIIPYYDIFIDGQAVQPGQTLSSTACDSPHTLQIAHGKKAETYQLIFLQSADVPTMYLHTVSGKMDHVHSQKGNEERCEVNIIAAGKEEIFQTSGFDARIRGRGNFTWGVDKKPYVLTLKRDAELFGMNPSKKWILLADMIDRNHIRNMISYRLARETSDMWNPNTQHVDLYLNGAYAGLYLLSEKVEISQSKLDIPENAVLFNFEATERAEKNSISGIIPGISAEICNRDSLSPETETYIKDVFQGVFKHTYTDEELQSVFDFDSWAWLYVIQEFTANFDAGRCSLYFYLLDGKLYAGPIWDYDNTFGVQSLYPSDMFLAKTDRDFWRSMLSYESFDAKARSIFCSKFYDLLCAWRNGQLEEDLAQISQANRLDHIRWEGTFRDIQSVVETVTDSSDEYFLNFYSERLQFLEDAWIKGKEYVDISLHYSNGYTRFLSIPKGTALDISRYSDDADLWYVHSPDTPADFSEPIQSSTDFYEFSDASVSGNSVQVASTFRQFLSEVGLAAIAVIGIWGIAFLVLIAVFLYRRNPWRTKP